MADVAAAVVGVADVEFAEHLAQAIRQVATRADAVGQGAILLPDAFPIHAMHLGVIEEIALQPPGLVQHLLPFFARIDAQRPAGKVDLRLFGFVILGRGVGAGLDAREPVLGLIDQDLAI